MKKFLIGLLTIFFIMLLPNVYATETDIPSMKLEELIMMMQTRQAKVDIIKKNNIQIENLKDELKSKIVVAAEKINNLKIEISADRVTISDETMNEFKELLGFIQDSTNTLEEDVEETSKEIEKILDLISSKGMDLAQYDKLIEEQNEVVVKMKKILDTVSKI